MSAAGKDVARRWLDELWNHGNFGAARDLVAPTYVRHDPDQPVRGIESYTSMIQAYRGAFKSLRFTCDDLVADSDKVLVRWTARASFAGKHEQEFEGADLLRIVDGKIAESWPLFDGLRLLRMMGLLRFLALVWKLRRATSA